MNLSQDKLKKVSELLKIHSFVAEKAFEEDPLECLVEKSEEVKYLFIKSLDKNKTHHSTFTQQQELYFMKWMELTTDVDDVISAYKIVFSNKLQNVVIRKLYSMV